MSPESTTALLYLAISIMSANRGTKTIVPEILYIGEVEVILNLIAMFGGTTIRIPSAEEFLTDLRVVLYAYYSIAERRSDDWFATAYNVDGKAMRSVRARLERWVSTCDPEELKFLKAIPGALDLGKRSNVWSS